MAVSLSTERTKRKSEPESSEQPKKNKTAQFAASVKLFNPLKSATVKLHLLIPWVQTVQKEPGSIEFSRRASKASDTIIRTRALGQGSFAHVFEVQDPDTKQQLALKENKLVPPSDILKKRVCHMYTDEDRKTVAAHFKDRIHHSIGRFQSILYEAAKIMFLRSQGVPHIPLCQGTILIGPLQAGFFMPVYGPNLLTLYRKETFSLRDIQNVGRQLFTVLQKLQILNYFHRDLKPENLCLDHDKNLIVLDWGFGAPAPRVCGELVQSRFYRAPEMTQGTSYGVEIDWWSAGCILFELFMGHPLFMSQSDEDHLPVIRGILTPPPTELPTDVKKAVDFIRKGSQDDFRTLMTKSLIERAQKKKDSIPDAMHLADLLVQIFHLAPRQRLNPTQVLPHPFFTPPFPQIAS